MRRRLLFILLTLSLLAVSLFSSQPKADAALDCDVVRANCRGVADAQQAACLQAGGSGDKCAQDWTWFYMTCTEGVGCPSGIN